MTLGMFPSVHSLTRGTLAPKSGLAAASVPEDPIAPAPTQCRNMSASVAALVAVYGSQAKLAKRLGISQCTMSKMLRPRPTNDQEFTIARVFVETVAACVSKGATVEDLLAGRLIERAKAVKS